MQQLLPQTTFGGSQTSSHLSVQQNKSPAHCRHDLTSRGQVDGSIGCQDMRHSLKSYKQYAGQSVQSGRSPTKRDWVPSLLLVLVLVPPVRGAEVRSGAVLGLAI